MGTSRSFVLDLLREKPGKTSNYGLQARSRISKGIDLNTPVGQTLGCSDSQIVLKDKSKVATWKIKAYDGFSMFSCSILVRVPCGRLSKSAVCNVILSNYYIRPPDEGEEPSSDNRKYVMNYKKSPSYLGASINRSSIHCYPVRSFCVRKVGNSKNAMQARSTTEKWLC